MCVGVGVFGESGTWRSRSRNGLAWRGLAWSGVEGWEGLCLCGCQLSVARSLFIDGRGVVSDRFSFLRPRSAG